MKNIIITLLGVKHDKKDPTNPNKWRPNASLGQLKTEDGTPFRVDEVLLIYNDDEHIEQAREIQETIQQDTPTIKVTIKQLRRKNPWNFEEVFSAYYQFAKTLTIDENAQYYLHLGTGTHVDKISFFLLANHHFLPAKLLQSVPPKENQPAHVITIDVNLERYQTLLANFEKTKCKNLSHLKDGIDTKNQAFNKMINEIETVSQKTKHPILLGGPTGAGKSKLAQRIFELKRETNQLQSTTSNHIKKFVAVNCATLSGDLAKSALFGHVKGSFSGADGDHDGFLKQADGGVLFLDEIGELPLETQAMLLKAIEEHQFRPLGSDCDEESTFQLICGTNRNLLEEVEAKRFRKDLLCRINIWSFRLPGLAERRDDIAPNIEYELQQNESDFGKVKFSKDAYNKFLEFACAHSTPWEGNFRDLRTAIIRMCTFANNGTITPDVVEDEIRRLRESWHNKNEEDELSTLLGKNYTERFDLADIATLKSAIPICRSSKNAAEAGKKFFNISREKRKSKNDSDRMTKFLQHFGLTFQAIQNNKNALN